MPHPLTPRLIFSGTFFLHVLLGLTGCSDDSSRPQYDGPYKHVVLITLDTTRADALGCYAGKAASTPRLDELAASGVRFDDVTSAAPSTLASHTSIMTGLYPRRHGVARNGFMVSAENVTLAEVLQQAGFHTAGFIGSFALDEMFHFNQGFEHWDQNFSIDFDPRHADQVQRTADEVTSAVLDYIQSFDGSQRLFLFAHYFDVHAPYAPPEPFASRYGMRFKQSDFGLIDHQVELHQTELIGKTRAIYTQGLSRRLAADATGQSLPGDEDLAALYAGELSFLDTQVGRLLDGLDQKGILEQSIVIVTADHGETFWEHGDFWHHGAWVYQTNVHVPLLLSLPDGRGKGRVVQQPVSSVDIFPTLLGLLGIALPEPVAGLDLSLAIDGGQLAPRSIFSEATQPAGRFEEQSTWANQLKTKSIRRGKWKYIHAPYLRYEELYDIENDPGERFNLLGKDDPALKATQLRLRRELDAWREVENPRASEYNSEQIERVMKKLSALGYTGQKPVPEEAPTGPDASKALDPDEH